MNDASNTRDLSARRHKKLRLAGGVVLVLGVCGAAIVYFAGRRTAELNDPLMEGYSQSQSRSDTRQMGVMYGKMGEMIEGLTEDLKSPGTQAFLILAGAVVAAGTLFLAGRDGTAETMPRQDMERDNSQ